MIAAPLTIVNALPLSLNVTVNIVIAIVLVGTIDLAFVNNILMANDATSTPVDGPELMVSVMAMSLEINCGEPCSMAALVMVTVVVVTGAALVDVACHEAVGVMTAA